MKTAAQEARFDEERRREVEELKRQRDDAYARLALLEEFHLKNEQLQSSPPAHGSQGRHPRKQTSENASSRNKTSPLPLFHRYTTSRVHTSDSTSSRSPTSPPPLVRGKQGSPRPLTSDDYQTNVGEDKHTAQPKKSILGFGGLWSSIVSSIPSSMKPRPSQASRSSPSSSRAKMEDNHSPMHQIPEQARTTYFSNDGIQVKGVPRVIPPYKVVRGLRREDHRSDILSHSISCKDLFADVSDSWDHERTGGHGAFSSRTKSPPCPMPGRRGRNDLQKFSQSFTYGQEHSHKKSPEELHADLLELFVQAKASGAVVEVGPKTPYESPR